MLSSLKGWHTWRQADAYSQILGLRGQNGLDGLQSFNAVPILNDIPVYQGLVAGAAWLLDSDVLVTARGLSLLLWVLLFSNALILAERLWLGSAKYVTVFSATSALYLH